MSEQEDDAMLAAVRARRAAITEGDWIAEGTKNHPWLRIMAKKDYGAIEVCDKLFDRDARFIEHAPDDHDFLIAYLDTQRTELTVAWTKLLDEERARTRAALAEVADFRGLLEMACHELGDDNQAVIDEIHKALYPAAPDGGTDGSET